VYECIIFILYYILAYSTKWGCLAWKYYIFVSTQNVPHMLIRHVCSNTSNNVHNSLYFFMLKKPGCDAYSGGWSSEEIWGLTQNNKTYSVTCKSTVKDCDEPGCSSTSVTSNNTVKVQDVICNDHRMRFRAIAKMAALDRESFRRILTDQLKRKTLKGNCSDLLQRNKNKLDLSNSVIRCDETQIFAYDPCSNETIAALEVTKLSKREEEKKATSHSKFNAKLLIAFDIQSGYPVARLPVNTII